MSMSGFTKNHRSRFAFKVNLCKLIKPMLRLIFVIASIALVFERLDLFFDHPVDLSFEFLSEKDVKFPSITICPEKQLSKNINYATSSNFSGISSFREIFESRIIMETSREDFVHFIQECQWQGKSCNKVYFWRAKTTMWGQCYTFNPGKQNKQNQYEKKSSLKLTLNVLQNTNFQATEIQPDWKIVIHNKDVDITCSILSLGSPVFPNTFNYVTYGVHMHKYENSHSRPCKSQKIVNTCLAQCMDSKLLGNATCRLPFMKTVDLPLCPTELTSDHPGSQVFQVFESTWSKCDCPLVCSTISYSGQIDSMGSPLNNATQINIKPPIQKTMVTHERCAYRFYNLICDIGATLGLFMGISLLDIFEGIEILLEMVANRCKKK